MSAIENFTKKVLVFGIIFLVLQICYGLIQTPSAFDLKSIVAVVLALIFYLFLTFKSSISLKKIDPSVLKISSTIGLVISFIYFIQIVSEYLFPVSGKIDEIWGYIAFGGLPLWFGLSGALSAFTTKKISAGITSAIWSAMISSLIWINILFLLYFIFFGTPHGYEVLQANETIADFKRSGMTSLSAFVVQDYLGATFFHLLLSLVAAIIFGSVGSLIGKILKPIRN